MIPAVLYDYFNAWTFGSLLCDLWIFLHQTSVSASILNLCALSIDRYLAIQRPFRYIAMRTTTKLIVYLVIIWVGAASISLPPLIHGNVYFDVPNQKEICLIYQNIGYQIYATIAEFYFPFAVMVFMYYKIYRVVRRAAIDEYRIQNSVERLLCVGNETERRTSIIPSVFQRRNKFPLKFVKHYKATSILGFLVFAFAACWLPFFVLSLTRLAIEIDHIDVLNTISLIFLWLGLLNSLIDPIINATMHRDFRRTIQEILRCRWSDINAVIRDNIFKRSFGSSLRRVSDK